MTSPADRNRALLLAEIARQQAIEASHWAEYLPIVSLELYFAEGVDATSIDSQRIMEFGVDHFCDRLIEIRARDDVSDVSVQVWDIDEGDQWSERGFFFIATSASQDEVESWLYGIIPDTFLSGGRYVRARTIRLEEINVDLGYHVWALDWRS